MLVEGNRAVVGWMVLGLAMIGLWVTNPDENAAKAWLVKQTRESIGRPEPGQASLDSILQSAASAAVPDLIQQSVAIRRQNFLIFSVYSATPQGVLAFALEYAGHVTLAREGVCMVGVAGSFFFCKDPGK